MSEENQKVWPDPLSAQESEKNSDKESQKDEKSSEIVSDSDSHMDADNIPAIKENDSDESE